MNIITEVAKELFSMFLADARLAIATLVLVAAVAVTVLTLHIEPLVSGMLLLAGCLIILIEATTREARRRRVG